MGSPGLRYWPGLTVVMPSRPPKGARMVFFATSAACAASCSRVLFRLADVGVELRPADRLRLVLDEIAVIGQRGEIRLGLQRLQLRDIRDRR